MAIETELKLAIKTQDIKNFLDHPLIVAANKSSRKARLHGTYFDTPEHDLFTQKISLRVRRENNSWIQAIKAAKSNTSGLHLRYEWEAEVEDDQLDLDQLPQTMKESIFTDKQFCHSVGPVFNVDIERTLWELTGSKGSKIEICLDQGTVSTKSDSLEICEIELELKSGHPTSLSEIALNLLKTIPLRIENDSKSTRGYQLLDPQLVTFKKSEILSLYKNMSAEKVFITCIQHCIVHMQENEDAVLLEDDPEGIHQMRVAIRRLRSGFTFFKPLIPAECYDELVQEVRWLSDLMGAVRDWDVFIGSLQQMLLINPDNDGIEEILINAQKEQQKHHQQLIPSMKSSRYTKLLLNLSLWLQHRPWRKQISDKQLMKLDRPIKRFSNKRLSKSHKKLLACGGECLRQLEPELRHKARIQSKKLAYSIRFVFSLYSQAATYMGILSSLRDDLGLLNDDHVAQELLKTPGLFTKDNSADQYLSGWFAARETIALENLETNWSNFLLQPNITDKSH